MAASHDKMHEIVLTGCALAQTGTIILKETIFLTIDKDDTVQYEWPAGTVRLFLLRLPGRTTNHTHAHTSLMSEAKHARQPLLRRQRISSVFNRTGASSRQWGFTVVHIDCGNTNTKGIDTTAYADVLPLHNYIYSFARQSLCQFLNVSVS